MLGSLDLGLHLVCPFLHTLLINLAIVHNLVREVSSKSSFFIREVRHFAVEVPRVFLFVLEGVALLLHLLANAPDFVAVRLASC